MAKKKGLQQPETDAAEASSAGRSPQPATFEESLAELQQIVNELEEGSLGLEESLSRFERGMTLLRTCYQTLEQAEQKIEILTGMDARGNPSTAPFDAAATSDQKPRATNKPQKQGKSASPSEQQETDEQDSADSLF